MTIISFRQFVGIGIGPLVTWAIRLKLRIEQAHNVRISETLHEQISNDTRALAYIHRQQAIINSRLQELTK